jgi:glycosyltransferase involved in cell wall biosynthesis
MGLPRVAIIVPAYNEETTISKQVEALKKYGHVCVVNDGSTDQTEKICSDLDCTIINLQQNCGYDVALETGIKRSLDYDYIVTCDADGQIDARYVNAVINKLNEGYDCVLGSRDTIPRFGEWFVNRITKYKYNVNDIFCGLKGYRADKIPRNFVMMGSTGSMLSLIMMKQNLKLSLIPIKVKNREGESRFGGNNIKTNFKILKVLKYV